MSGHVGLKLMNKSGGLFYFEQKQRVVQLEIMQEVLQALFAVFIDLLSAL